MVWPAYRLLIRDPHTAEIRAPVVCTVPSACRTRTIRSGGTSSKGAIDVHRVQPAEMLPAIIRRPNFAGRPFPRRGSSDGLSPTPTGYCRTDKALARFSMSSVVCPALGRVGFCPRLGRRAMGARACSCAYVICRAWKLLLTAFPRPRLEWRAEKTGARAIHCSNMSVTWELVHIRDDSRMRHYRVSERGMEKHRASRVRMHH